MATVDGRIGSRVKKDTCAICLERFRRPKLLPCFHTFCQSCLASLASSAPSFQCPSCRVVTIVPPAGVGAFQTNFYIESDLDDETERRCEVCVEEKTATQKCLQCQQVYCEPCKRIHDSCTFGRSHTIIPIQTPSGQTEVATTMKESRQCSKHADQLVILRCTACELNICIQCKLTLHEGHATEDLVDTSVKVKAKLQSLLETRRNQKRLCEAVLANSTEKVSEAQNLQQNFQEGIRHRAETLIQWVQSARDDALESLRSSTDTLLTSLQAGVNEIQDLTAMLSVQCDHIERVLDAGDIADAMSLERELSKSTLNCKELSEFQEDFKRKNVLFSCLHDSTAINQNCIRAFIGLVQSSQRKRSYFLASKHSSVMSNDVPRNVSSVKTAPKVISYSQNPNAVISSICPVGENRIWVQYSPDNISSVTKLLNDEGHLLDRRLNQNLYRVLQNIGDDNILTCVTTSNVTFNNSWIDRCEMLNLKIEIVSVAKRHGAVCYTLTKKEEQTCVVRVTCTSLSPLRCEFQEVVTVPCQYDRDRKFDVSSDEIYFSFVMNENVSVYAKQENSNKSHMCGQYKYCTPKGENWSNRFDVCFYQIDERELLLIVDSRYNYVLMVDHTDGCVCVNTLNNNNSNVLLNRPSCFAKDCLGRLWIGCQGGRVVLIDP